MRVASFIALILLLATPSPTIACQPEPASQWAPAGYSGCEQWGIGTASTWQGPGSATNDCLYPWTSCTPRVVTSLDTGRSITVVPQQFCHCYVNAPGPNGETARLIDLAPDQVAALGLNVSAGLFRVSVEPATYLPMTLPDTRMTP